MKPDVELRVGDGALRIAHAILGEIFHHRLAGAEVEQREEKSHELRDRTPRAARFQERVHIVALEVKRKHEVERDHYQQREQVVVKKTAERAMEPDHLPAWIAAMREGVFPRFLIKPRQRGRAQRQRLRLARDRLVELAEGLRVIAAISA